MQHHQTEQHNFDGPVDVKCPICGTSRTIPKRDRNRRSWPGAYCDGIGYGMRHGLAQMVGPEGKARS